MVEKAYRSIVKSLSWRFLGTIYTVIVVYLLTGKFEQAFAFGGVEIVLKMLMYYFHERMWNKIKLGRIEDNAGVDYNI